GNDVLLITGDKQPTTAEGINALAYYLTRILSMLEPRDVLILGTSIRTQIEEPSVYYAATDEKNLRNIKLSKIVDKDGIFLGINTMVGAFLKQMYNIPSKILLVDVPPFLPIYAKGAITAIREVEDSYKLGLNLEEIEKKFKNIEHSMKIFEQYLPDLYQKKEEEEGEEVPKGYVS
ncbi:MAG: PAC2 family protein, partial [Candidatus Korarchaeota archaeon]